MATKVLEAIRIVSTPGVLDGKPRIEGHRISVQQVAIWYEHLGWSTDEIGEAYNLTPAEVYAALAYYHARRREIDQAIQREEAEHEKSSAKQGSLRDLIEGDLHRIMTPKEIAEEFGVTPDAVYQAIRRDTIPHRKSGGAILIRRWDALARWGKNKR